MSRPLRIEFPGVLYHLTSRGVGRDDIYLTDDDRALFLSVLGQVCERFNWECHSSGAICSAGSGCKLIGFVPQSR
jgi:putative transposase